MSTDNDMQALVLARVREVERKDEEQIILELSGEVVKEFIYEFPMEGKVVRGLSWAGFKELAFRRGNIQIGRPIIEDGGDHWRCLVEATDLERNVTFWAGTHQRKFRRINDRDTKGYHEVPDDFAVEKAISKAQRNVLKNLIPQSIQDAAIEAVVKGIAIPGGKGTRGREIAQPRRTSLPAAPKNETPKTPGELWNAGLAMGYKNRADMMVALNIRNDSEVGDLAEALATLRALKVDGVPEKEAPNEEEMKRDGKDLFGGR